MRYSVIANKFTHLSPNDNRNRISFLNFITVNIIIIPFLFLLFANDQLFKENVFINGISFQSIATLLSNINWLSLFFTYIVFLMLSVMYLQFKEKINKFVYKYRYLIGVCVVFFCVVFEISGSSMTEWFNTGGLPFKDTSNVLFGKSRPIRTDEWIVNTPLAISQTLDHFGSFHYYNDIMRGTSTDMFIVYGQPVLDISMIFRPFLVGYLFLGASKGLAFFWVARAVFLFLITFDFFRIIVTNNNKKLSLLAAFLLLFMPFIQWWYAVNGLVEMFISGQLALLCLHKYILDSTVFKRWIYSTLFFICAGVFILTFYPAQMIPLFYVFLMLVVVVILRNRKDFQFHFKKDIWAILIPFVVIMSLLMRVFILSFDTIQAVLNSAYPGKRLFLNGEKSKGAFRGLISYPSSLFLPFTEKNVVVNTCEMAKSLDFFPMGFVLSVFYFIKKRRMDILLIVGFIIGLFLFMMINGWLPVWLLKITMLTYSTPGRAMVGLYFINILLLIRFFAINKFIIKKRLQFIIGSIVFVITMYCTYTVFDSNSHIEPFEPYMSSTMMLLCAVYLLIGLILILNYANKKFQNICLAFLISTTFIVGISVNPINRSINNVLDNQLIVKLKNIVEGDPKGKWIVTKDILANTSILAGASTINSINTYPNIETWKKIDPIGKYESIYNRYAHLSAEITNGASEFELIGTDAFLIKINKYDLSKIGVSYILSKEELEEFNDDEIVFEKVENVTDFKVFKISYLP